MIGAPPRLAGKVHVTWTVGEPGPRFSADTRAARFKVFDGALNPVETAFDTGLAPLLLTAVSR